MHGTMYWLAVCTLLTMAIGYPCTDPTKPLYTPTMPARAHMLPLCQLWHTHAHYGSYDMCAHYANILHATHTCLHCQLCSNTAACNTHYGTHVTMPTMAHMPTASAMAHPYGHYGTHLLTTPAMAHTCPTHTTCVFGILSVRLFDLAKAHVW